jgi:hypothetical protein
MTGPLQADKQALDVVKLDGVAGQPGDVVRQPVIRRLGLDDMVAPREDEDVVGGLG